MPSNIKSYEIDYHGWANINNGRYYISGNILDKNTVWHTFTADGMGTLMEIDGKKIINDYFDKKFNELFVDIKISMINGQKNKI